MGLFFILIFIRVLCRVVGRSTRESTTISYWPVLATGGRHIENHFVSLSIQSLLNCIFLALSVSRRREPYKVNGFNFLLLFRQDIESVLRNEGLSANVDFGRCFENEIQLCERV